jgi:hypothetical protein
MRGEGRQGMRAFRFEGRLSKPLLAALLVVNAIVLANACLHPADIQYDAHEHMAYIQTLADFHLPTQEKS